MKKKFITVCTYAGLDWHDAYSYSKMLSENEDMSITNVSDMIINDIFSKKIKPHEDVIELDAIKKMIEGIINDSGKKLSIPLAGDILKNKDDPDYENENTIYENEITIHKDKQGLVCDISGYYGQYTSTSTYIISEIEEENVCYLPICAMRINAKPVRSADSLLAPATTSYEECKKTLDEIQVKSPVQKYFNGAGVPDTFYVGVDDITRLKENSWYKQETEKLSLTNEELMDNYKKEFSANNLGNHTSLAGLVFSKHITAFDRLFPEIYEKTWKPKNASQNESESVEQENQDDIDLE